MHNLEDREYVRRLFRTKDGIIRILNKVLNKTTLDEILLLEIYLNTEIRRLMEKEILDKIGDKPKIPFYLPKLLSKRPQFVGR